MSKQFNDNENDLVPYSEYEALVKPFLKTLSNKIQEIINTRLIKYREKFSSSYNAFQIQLKNQSKSFSDSMKEATETSKAKLNECSSNNLKDIISLFRNKCALYQNIINTLLNEFENLISLVQTERCGILKDIDEISFSCNNIWMSLLPNDSNGYQKNIGEPISKFRDEMNSMLERLLKKLCNVMTSHQNIIYSLMESFEKEMNEIINFGK